MRMKWKGAGRMQFAIDLPPFGPFSDPHLVAQLAQEAEEAGWHGFFLWDHLNYKLEGSPEPMAIADPWIHLAAMALRTTSIKLGPMVTPLPRRRPWKLARETVTLDHLCGGRLVLGIGLGSDYDGEYHDFGKATDPRVHGVVLTQRSGGSKLKRVDSPQKGKGSCKRSNEPLHESLSKKRSNWRDRATNRERKLHAIWELPIARCIIGASNVQNTASKHFPVADTKLRKKRKYVI